MQVRSPTGVSFSVESHLGGFFEIFEKSNLRKEDIDEKTKCVKSNMKLGC